MKKHFFMQYDVFICHASEDKADFVRPLAELLIQQNIHVWYDEFSLSIGDSLTQKIDHGLTQSNFGVVVLSTHFFNKPWAKRELNGLTFREMIENRNLILPIWHNVGAKEVAEFSPPLADKKAAISALGINSVMREIKSKVKPEDSPLVIARNELTSLGLNPPSISDEWWLDMIEEKELLKYPDINLGTRWIFPIPFPNDDRGYKRGRNIMSAALQFDWSFAGDVELNIDSITPPEQVHEFIHKWPGLYDCARTNPEILALYVPQITIPGFDNGFEDVFDELLRPDNKRADIIFSYSEWETVDDKEPLCGDVIAYRHPVFGNYTITELAHWYFDAHDMHYIRSHWNIFQGLIWLISDESKWLPERYRQMFIEGILKQDQWFSAIRMSENEFVRCFHVKSRKQFKLTNTGKQGLIELIEATNKEMGIGQSSQVIFDRLMNMDFVSSYFNYQEWLDAERRKR